MPAESLAISQVFANTSAGNFYYMQEKHKTAPSPGFNLNLADIYHVLFRHKWKIIIVWVLGGISAGVLYLKWPVPYSSEAILAVRYVVDKKDYVITENTAPNMISTSPGADTAIRLETETLLSLDVTREAAEILGPETVFKLTGTTNSYVAAAVIRNGLDVDTPSRSQAMHVFFRHRDPEIVEAVLTQVIQSYFNAHRRVHQLNGNQDEALTMRTDTLKSQHASLEAQLSELKSTNGVTTLEETKKTLADNISKISEELWSAETEMEVLQTVLNSFTNATAKSVKTDTNTPGAPTPPPSEKISDYKDIGSLLDQLKSRRSQLRLDFPDQSPRVVAVQEQIDRNQKLKTQLETEYPQLTAYRSTPTSTDGRTGTPGVDFINENAKMLAFQTRITRLKQHLQETKVQLDKLLAVESKIKELERQRASLETDLASAERRMGDEKNDEELNKGKPTNIPFIQKPSTPSIDTAKRTKIVRAVLLGALAAGLALAFSIELYFDRSFKRPIEIETKLGLPLFLSIPETQRNGKHPHGKRNVRLLSAGATPEQNGSPTELTEPDSWKSNPAMQPFFEALRDRLITHFEIKEINHKPKLVAVTSCTPGSGVSTVASGLAASLSETGEGNVLLVDMNTEKGAAHFFQKGRLDCGLDDILDKDSNRENAQVEKNLFVVSESTAEEKLPRILHKRFSALIPKLHASDFDYIIFDMPPVSQTSATNRVARFMDMVFLVVEAEKTDRDIVKRASQMLTESKAVNVGVVLNKSHNYVPSRLNQEL